MDDSELSYLKFQVDELKLMLNCPRIFITKYFERLRNQLDLEITDYLISTDDSNFKNERISENDHYLTAVEKLIKKEKKCLKYVHENFKYDTAFEKKIIEDIKEYETTLANQNLFTHSLKDSIYKRSIEIQRILFRHECFIILNKDILTKMKIFDFGPQQSNKNVFHECCILIEIENDVIGERGIDYLKDLYREERTFFPNEQHKSDYKTTKITHKMRKKCGKELLNIVALKSCLQWTETIKEKINLASIKTVDMNNLDLTEIDSRTFEGNINTESIHLDINELESIPEDLFHGLGKNLNFINLSFNRIKTLEPKTFKNLLNLGAIDLSYNQIDFIEPALFEGLVHLTDLNLSYNKISSLCPNMFSSLNNLLNLHLSGNEITFLKPDAFERLVNLRRLFLDSNKVLEVPVEIFDYLISVELINLRNNQLDEIDFERLKNLRQGVKFIFD